MGACGLKYRNEKFCTFIKTCEHLHWANVHKNFKFEEKCYKPNLMDFQTLQIWSLLAGLGLFLFGMFMMEESLKKLVGRSFKIFLRKHTNNSVKAVLSGTFITAILQSSSMVSLLVMSFAGAGIIGIKKNHKA